MSNIRIAQTGELPEFDNLAGTVFLAEEDGQIAGHIAVRVLHGLAWITDLKYWGQDPTGAIKLMTRARREVREDLGLDEYRLTVDPEYPALFHSLVEHGHSIEQIVMKGHLRVMPEAA